MKIDVDKNNRAGIQNVTRKNEKTFRYSSLLSVYVFTEEIIILSTCLFNTFSLEQLVPSFLELKGLRTITFLVESRN